MHNARLNVLVLGLTISSSWGNGHATTYRALIKALYKKGHMITFLERDVPWYAVNRDLGDPHYCNLFFYTGINELKQKYGALISNADLVIVGSYVPEGVEVGKYVTDTAGGITAFYDIDTPVTLAKINEQDYEYLHPDLIPLYDLYLSFTGGPILEYLKKQFGAPMAKALYCSVDPELYYPENSLLKWDLGYIGTYSSDRQSPLKNLLLDAAAEMPAGKFVVAGPQYPGTINWPINVERIEHLPPCDHRHFYNSQRFTLNITRKNMIDAGYSPSVRLFEAAACGTPVISDNWAGLDELFKPGEEILISNNSGNTRHFLGMGEDERLLIAEKARKKVLKNHTAAQRAAELEDYYQEALHRKMLNAAKMLI